MTGAEQRDTEGDDRVGAGSWYALALLMGIFTMHAVDRSVVSVLLEPIKHEFGMSDTQMGALGAITHGLAFALTTIPLGMLADRANRVKLVSGLVAIWSGLTFLCGFASNATTLFIARFGVGAAEGGFHSSALSLISDIFPARRRSTALGIFYLSTAIGTGCIFLVGGYVAANYGWRAAFLVAGFPGLLLALLTWLTLREPQREGSVKEQVSHSISPRKVLAYIGGTRSIVYAILGTTLAVMMISSFWHWMVSFLVRTHGMDLGQAGFIMALTTGPAQAVTSVLAGPIADRYARGRADRIGYVPATALLVAVPVGLVVLFGQSLTVVIGATLLFGAVMGAWVAQAFGTVLTLARSDMRGSVVGVMQLFTNLIGTGMGSIIVGGVSDATGSIRWGLLTVLCLALPAAFFLILSSRRAGAEAAA